MKRPLKPEEVQVWGAVAATVRPLPGRSAKTAQAQATKAEPAEVAARVAPPKPLVKTPKTLVKALAKTPAKPVRRPEVIREAPEDIEPRRRHRIARERDPIGGRLDLHGLDQDQAKATLEAFLRRAWDQGDRAVLVITGKGVQGDGVLRRRAPEWLAAPALAGVVAGVSPAARQHGGEGALYVALKRKRRD